MTDQSSAPQESQTEKKAKNGKKKSLRDKARKMLLAHQLEALMHYGVFPEGLMLQYPTPPHTEGEDGEVNRGSTRYFLNGLAYFRKCFPGEQITVRLGSPGGDEYAMFAVYDAIADTRYDNRIIIEVDGSAMSAGALILQAGHRRLLRPHARIMVHYGSWKIPEMNAMDAIKVGKENEVLCEMYRKILIRRLREKDPDYNEEVLHTKLSTDWYLSAQEAVDIGLADEIVG